MVIKHYAQRPRVSDTHSVAYFDRRDGQCNVLSRYRFAIDHELSYMMSINQKNIVLAREWYTFYSTRIPGPAQEVLLPRSKPDPLT